MLHTPEKRIVRIGKVQMFPDSVVVNGFTQRERVGINEVYVWRRVGDVFGFKEYRIVSYFVYD